MLHALILVPALAGLLAFAIRSDRPRRALLAAAALAHAALAAAAWRWPPAPALDGWLQLDAPGLVFLEVTSLLFLAAALYAIGYLARQGRGRQAGGGGGKLLANAPEAVFTGCLLLFLATMTLVTASHHLGILWVAIEATTLASAPLIYFHRQRRSLEATWKYLLICSVGIALALLGNFFLAVAAKAPGEGAPPLLLGTLIADGAALDARWLRAAFLFLLIGYGTKMGLAPLHTWLPDAHSEAPPVVSALLSGALLNCAFLGILRAHQVCAAAGEAAFARGLLLGFGLASIGLASAFIIGQSDYKRLLAYSSIDHMGILALGVGLGGAGAFGAMLHAVNHSLAKAMMFLVAGNILAAYRSKSAVQVRGALRALPISGALWVVAFLAVSGVPPSGLFLSEFTILRAALDQGRQAVAAAYLALLAVIFIGMATAVLRMAQGPAPDGGVPVSRREPLLAVLPPAALGALVFILGVHIPHSVRDALDQAARALGGI